MSAEVAADTLIAVAVILGSLYGAFYAAAWIGDLIAAVRRR